MCLREWLTSIKQHDMVIRIHTFTPYESVVEQNFMLKIQSCFLTFCKTEIMCVDQQKAAWFESDLYTSDVSCIAILLTICDYT